ncbi:MAG: peptidase domain-containing ABC transporter, partial [Methylotenera sp.]|nr:peptidase domain-containing ABC transporter [Methylotenera sp.]
MVQSLTIEAFVWATGAFCQLNRIPHDAALLIKQYPPPYDIIYLQQALNHFGLSNSLKQSNLNQLPQASMPCLAILNPTLKSQTDSNDAVAPILNATQSNTDSNASSVEQSNTSPSALPPDAQANQNYDIALILRRDDQRLLVLHPGQAEPVTVSIDDQDFNARITGDFLMVRKVEEALTDEDGVTQGNTSQAAQANASSNSCTNQDPVKEFGFRWFIPELLKYKK